jgi:periplasmic divalent cation tolerance protein
LWIVVQDLHEAGAGASGGAAICYLTVGSREEAVAIARAVVEERLASGANVIDGVSSLYWWRGSLEQAAETVVVLKTRRALLPALAGRIRQLHSYDCPAIVALPVAWADPDYLRWIEQETQAERGAGGPPAQPL